MTNVVINVILWLKRVGRPYTTYMTENIDFGDE